MGRSGDDPAEGKTKKRATSGHLDESGTRHAVQPQAPGLLLVLEDMPVVATSHTRAARRIGARTRVESTVEGALSFLEANDVSGLLIDVNLGDGGDGLDFLRRAREEQESFVAAMVLSGLADDQLTLAPYRLGAIYRPKPGDGDELRRFFRMVARWPAFRRSLEKIVEHYSSPRDPRHRLTRRHLQLVQQYLFFGRESLDERLGVSKGTRKRLQKPLLEALALESLDDIWEVLSLFEGASDVSIRNLLGGT